MSTLSAVRPDGTRLWIAGDETATIERLTVDGAGYGEHTTFRLADVLTLPGGPEDEVDVEGLARQRHWVYRWRDARQDADPSRVVRAPALRRELDLPFGDGDDHAEGIGLLDGHRLLVVYDSPAPDRLVSAGIVLADVVSL